MTTANETTDTMLALLSHLHRGGAWAHYWTDKDGNGKKRSLWFPVGNPAPIPAGWAGGNVYFSVHPCAQIPPKNGKGEETPAEFVRVQMEHIGAINCLYAEYDAKHFEGGKAAIVAHLDSFPHGQGWPYPSAVVDSGGGFHCYWLLEHTVTVTDENRVDLKRLQAAWVELVGGDAGTKDLARILRVPGTLNVKPEYGPNFPTVTVIEADFRRLYGLAEFEGLTEHLRAEQPTPAQPSTSSGHYSFTDDLARAAANLKRLRPGRADDYQEWVNVGMALCSLGGAGLQLWEDWSKGSAKYAPGVCEKKWKSFTPGDGLTLGSLAHWADEDDPSSSSVQRPVKRQNVEAGGRGAAHQVGRAPVGDGSLLDDLLAGLASIGDDREELTFYALDSVPQLTELDAAGFARFGAQLVTCGLPSEWVRRELRPAVNAAKKNESNGKTWTDYVEAAQTLGYSFRLNDLGDTVETNGERLTDVHEAVLLSKLHAQGLKNADVARRAFTTAAAQDRYHPVKEYLEGLKWDGQDHIGKLAGHFSDTHEPITYADGTGRTVIHAFLRRWLLGAVGKVYNPTECQNPMLIFDGLQGSGKSFFAKWVCPLPRLHFEGAIRPDDKDYSGYVTTRWIWEVSELGATMRKADREALKAFITQQDATYRPAYGRHDLVKPALASFIGTVNFEGALLGDPTGHRRFWPVNLGGLDWNYSRAVDVNQVWAHAYALYRAGEPWALSTEERAAHAAIVEAYEVEDVLAGYVQECFTIDPGNEALYTHTTTIIDTLRTYAGVKDTGKGLAMQLSSTLNRLGLRKTRRRDGAKNPRWGYVGIAKPTG